MMRKTLQHMYEEMATIRLLEDKLQRYCDEGMAGDLHFNKGQEAVAVGVCAALKASDKIVTHHRTIAHQIAKGAALRPLIAELLGKSTGTNGGRAGEMHMSDPSIGHEFSFQLVGTCITVGAGLAWALRNFKKTDDVVAIFFGDAAASNGQFHEGLNLIAVHRLPVLLVCENNHRAGNITPEHYLPGYSVKDPIFGTRRPSIFAAGYGIDHVIIDGTDPMRVARAADEVMNTVRRGRPFMLECDVERLCWHKQGQRDVRTKEELVKASERDPLRSIPDGISVDMVAIGRMLDELIESVLKDPPPSYER